VNLKNLEGKTIAQQKELYEIELVADYNTEYGNETNWSNNIIDAFNEEWDEIQKKFKLMENKE
jgi:hypothetical protein